MKIKPNIYFNISENSGVGYYRQYLQADALREQKLANVLINDFTWGQARIFCKLLGYDCPHVIYGFEHPPMIAEYAQHLKEAHNVEMTPELQAKVEGSISGLVEPAPEMLNKIGHWADIIVFGRRDVPEYISQWGGMRDFFNIPIVLDTDDNVHATRPFNPGYRGYHPGAPSLEWNKKCATEVDAITVSTENLRQVHLRDNPNIYVLPNSLELDKWDITKPEHEEIRIGLLMSSSHHEDVKMIAKVIPEIMKKHPNVHFYYTSMYNYFFGGLDFPGRLHPAPWIALKDWPKGVVNLGLDIGLAPLVDNFFNRAKSNLRYLEYSAAKMATVASPVEPYKCIQDGKTGFLARTTDDWTRHISTLIEDSTKRKEIASNAFKYVSKHFDVKKNAKAHLMVYNKIIRDFKKSKGKPKFPRNSLLFHTASLPF